MKKDIQSFFKTTFHQFLIPFITILFFLFCGGGPSKLQEGKQLYILHAGSLSVPFKEMAEAFKKKYPDIEILMEGHGSRTCARLIRELGKKVDIFGSADSDVIKNLLIPDHAEFVIDFSTNEMVVAFTDNSLFHNEINQKNWYNILLRDEVEVGQSDPNADPCGYRAALTCMLAEKYYREINLYNKLKAKIPMRNIRSKEVDLLAMLEVGELDYIFIYKSVASQHNLPFINLPPQINLSSKELKEFYQSVSIKITGKKPGQMINKKGSAMVYGLTIPVNAPHKKSAKDFLNFILSKEGQEIMKKNGQGVITPPVIDNLSNLPEGVVFGE